MVDWALKKPMLLLLGLINVGFTEVVPTKKKPNDLPDTCTFIMSSLCAHAIAWSEVSFFLDICLEHFPLWSKVIQQHPFILQVLSQITFFSSSPTDWCMCMLVKTLTCVVCVCVCVCQGVCVCLKKKRFLLCMCECVCVCGVYVCVCASVCVCVFVLWFLLLPFQFKMVSMRCVWVRSRVIFSTTCKACTVLCFSCHGLCALIGRNST